ncbi:DUF397 domain-containing protein [Streptomyces sp. SID10853]|uniref:DUF397 domain-containing protein n=1 Tax=Streptomyces sp. SID10853 TaxID=2706028 RepID=UPI0013C0F9F0|nr:DUF397 domain-containing protein [Streptomyces sp. SID10853]NDZ77258.1 DUF397 domain-containing protein [Streptomyces sp. SID10853]
MADKRIATPVRTCSFRSSTDGQECAEAAGALDGSRAVRDSKRPAYGTTYHSPTAWTAFLAAMKADGSR